ncbi:Crp/Fnr family transcriptional regulator [Vulcanimicrobium alpinum]|uniref:Crp/Fnr family transcriptional regulator n=1 Tax=Vulcanimicrobium alpinum TaxID=3016050 RepID=A0AAN1XY10_UNVUL|nr:Crp/Fnr family transcriptional regulator [Vulcanimicrobium alpinum]
MRKADGASAARVPVSALARFGVGRPARQFQANQRIFSQGDAADAVFYVRRGKVKLTAMSSRGKEAVIAMLGVGEFFGEGCLAGQPLRMSTAESLEPSSLVRTKREDMIAMLRSDAEFGGVFIAHLLSRNIRIEEDLVDQLFNSSEKRLARILLLLANFGKEGQPEPVVAQISQATLADMIGTTRSRVSFFMNKFRRLGFIEYNGGLHVHSSLLSVVLHD